VPAFEPVPSSAFPTSVAEAAGDGSTDMMSVPQLPQVAVDVAPLRLTLKAVGPTTGYVDGGWWQHSRDLGAEASDLANAVTLRLGPVREIAYALDAWEAAPHHVENVAAGEGRWVELVGFASQDPDVVLVTGTSGRTLGLLVVPPETPAPAGRNALGRAASAGDAESPAALLAAAGVRPTVPIPGPRRPRNFAPRRAGLR
jgi:hypothetical protein